MTFAEPGPYAGREMAARRLVEITNSVEAVQAGRITDVEKLFLLMKEQVQQFGRWLIQATTGGPSVSIFPYYPFGPHSPCRRRFDIVRTTSCGRPILPAGPHLGLSWQLPVRNLRPVHENSFRYGCVLRRQPAFALRILALSIDAYTMTVWIYVDARKQVGDQDHLKVFANAEAAEAWLAENDPEGVAFEYPIAD